MSEDEDPLLFTGKHYRRWLRGGMTGCRYALRLATGRGLLATESYSDLPTADELTGSLEAHAEENRSVAFVLPELKTQRALLAYLDRLAASSDRWSMVRRDNRVDDSYWVGLEWKTAEGRCSDIMGFAPFPSMPITRRAPYVVIAAWPGGRKNSFRPEIVDESRVSFLDARHDCDRQGYDALWQASLDDVSKLLMVPADDSRHYRDVAFVFSATLAPTG